jgi:hypothetical protein
VPQNVFADVLARLKDKGVEPVEARTFTTPDGPMSHAMVVTFRRDDAAFAEEAYNELQQSGFEPHLSADRLTVTVTFNSPG